MAGEGREAAGGAAVPDDSPESGAPYVVVATEPWQRDAETQIRWDVFAVEQGVAPVLEIDARDYRDEVIHLLAVVPAVPSGVGGPTDHESAGSELAGSEPARGADGLIAIGTARIIPDAEPGHYHLGRIAVRKEWRGSGVGALLVRGAHEVLRARLAPGESVVVALDAQVQARGFYERLGYEAVSEDVFLDAGIPHVTMMVTLMAAK